MLLLTRSNDPSFRAVALNHQTAEKRPTGCLIAKTRPNYMPYLSSKPRPIKGSGLAWTDYCNLAAKSLTFETARYIFLLIFIEILDVEMIGPQMITFSRRYL